MGTCSSLRSFRTTRSRGRGRKCTIEYAPEQPTAAESADVVVLVRVRDKDVQEWTSIGYAQAFAGTVIGHDSFAVVVDPACPLKEMSLADMKAVLSGKVQSWEQLGLPARPIRVLRDAWAGTVLGPLITTSRSSVRWEQYSEKAALGVAGHPDAIGFIATRSWLPAIGLRMVRIICDSPQDAEALPPDRLSILCRDGASPEAQNLAAFIWDRLAGCYETKAGAWGMVVGLPAREIIWPKPGGTGPGKTPGAVACLPMQSRLNYFLALTPDHVKEYEVQLEQALAANAGLTMVDRRELRQTLAEWRLAFIGGDGAPQAGKMLAADVLLEPTLVDDSQHAYLSLQALHVQTGSVLGHMKLAIDPDRTGQFDLHLDQRMAAWWPGVLVNLRRVRTLPIVSVRGTGQGSGAVRQAQRLRDQVQEALAEQGRCFTAPYQTTINAQTEMLLQAMGLASPQAAYRSVAFDYVLEIQLLSNLRAKLRIVAPASGKEMARGIVDGTSVGSLATAVRAWVVRHCGTLARPSERPHSSASDEWFAQQAMREFQAAETACPGIASAIAALPDKSPERLPLARDLVRRYLAAYQLDPANERIAYRLLELASRYGDDLDLPEAPILTEVAGRYILTFPNSNRDLRSLSTWMYRGLVLYYSGGAGEGFRHVGFPDWMEKYERQLPDLEARLQAYRVLADWLIRATKGTPDEEKFMFPRYWMDHYLVALVEYLRLTKVSDEQLAQVVASWVKRYDAYPQVVPPSEFLLLGALIARGEKRGALEQFSKMVQQRPDPSDKFWTFFGRDMVSDMLAQVDQNLRDEARRWLKGRMQTDELRALVRHRLSAMNTTMPGE